MTEAQFAYKLLLRMQLAKDKAQEVYLTPSSKEQLIGIAIEAVRCFKEQAHVDDYYNFKYYEQVIEELKKFYD